MEAHLHNYSSKLRFSTKTIVLDEQFAQKCRKPWFCNRNHGFLVKTIVFIKTKVLDEQFAQNIMKPWNRYQNHGFWHFCANCSSKTMVFKTIVFKTMVL